MKMHNVEQGSAEWQQLRCGTITATDTNCLMVIPKDGSAWGKGAKTYIQKKARDKYNGFAPKQVETDAMRWGKLYEPVARAKYEENTRDSVALVGFVEYEEGIGCSPDGFIRTDMLIEIKCPYNQEVFKGYVKENEAPKKYLVQMLHQIVTTGRDICAFFAYDPRTNEHFLKVYSVGMIEDLLGYTLTEYFARVRSARDAIALCAEAIKLANSGEKECCGGCNSQVLTFSDHRDNEIKEPWEK